MTEPVRDEQLACIREQVQTICHRYGVGSASAANVAHSKRRQR
jgi:hypothetical protein